MGSFSFLRREELKSPESSPEQMQIKAKILFKQQ